MTEPDSSTRHGIPIIGVLSPIARIVFLIVVGLAVGTIVASLVIADLSPTLVFGLAATSILGLAWLIGQATQRIGAITGPQVGGILNATFGNIAELIIAFFALQAGLIDVVKASLTGSIIGNLLLVLGLSVLVGGLRNGRQTFSREIAGSNAALLVLAAIGLFVPAVLALSSGGGEGSVVEDSVLVAVFLIAGYVLSLIYQFTNPSGTLGGHEARDTHEGPGWSGRTAAVVLVGAAILLAILSEILVGAIQPVVDTLGLTAFFVGVIILPVIGNLAEQLVAVQLAFKNRMEFSMAVSYGASLQVALFVAPVLVLLGVLTGHPMDLVFAPLEIVAVGAAVGISALIALDGESNWLEGALLVIVYLILAVSFFELVPK
ncbi:MAG TPA: calcium/proton exchanger [Candidatus Limnocylindrales bacterium]|nr:calcium/proton exchanger [Candidatus Limnocylindrales bacterium]